MFGRFASSLALLCCLAPSSSGAADSPAAADATPAYDDAPLASVRAAAERGEAAAQFELANRLAFGVDVAEDRWVREADAIRALPGISGSGEG